MKNSLFITALAALPSFISAFSIFSDLHIRDVYEPTLSIREAIPYFHVDNDAFEVVMRSLEARFIDAASDTAAYIARRDLEEDLLHNTLERRTKESDAYHKTEGDFNAAAAAYVPIDNSPDKSCDDKIKAAEKVLALARSVVSQRRAEAKKYNDNDPGHQTAIKNWDAKVTLWQKNVSKHRFAKKCEERKKNGK